MVVLKSSHRFVFAILLVLIGLVLVGIQSALASRPPDLNLLRLSRGQWNGSLL